MSAYGAMDQLQSERVKCQHTVQWIGYNQRGRSVSTRCNGSTTIREGEMSAYSAMNRLQSETEKCQHTVQWISYNQRGRNVSMPCKGSATIREGEMAAYGAMNGPKPRTHYFHACSFFVRSLTVKICLCKFDIEVVINHNNGVKSHYSLERDHSV